MPRNGRITKDEHLRNKPIIEANGGNKKPAPFRSDMTPEQKQLWFEQALKHGFIDQKYGTFDQLNTVLKWLRGSGLGDADIRKLLGFQTDNPVIKKGQIYGRGIRESISPAERADMDAVLGEGTAKKVEKYLRSKWAKARKLLTLEDVRTGKWSDLGHFIEGSLRDPDLAAGENAILNRKAGSEGERPERFPTDVVEQIAPVNPGEQAWNAAAEQNGGIEKRSGLEGIFPQDVAELADFDFIDPEQIPILAQKLEALDPTQRRAVVENIKATGQVDLNINPDSYKTADLTAVNGSSDTTLTVDDVSTLRQNGNGDDVQFAEYTKDQWRKFLNDEVPRRDFENIQAAIRATGSDIDQQLLQTPLKPVKPTRMAKTSQAATGFAGEIAPYAIDPEVGVQLGKGDIGGAAREVAQNVVEDVQYMFHNPYETFKNIRNTAAAGAVLPGGVAAAGIVSMVNGSIRLVEGIAAGATGFDSVEDYREFNAEQREVESEKLADTLLRLQEEQERNR